MAIARVQDATFNHDTGTVEAWPVTLGAAPTVGDVLYAVVAAIAPSITWTATGWTSVKAEAGNSNIQMTVFRREVQAGDGTTVGTFTPSAGTKGFAWVGEYSGVDTTTPEDATASGTASSSVTSASASVTVATANAWDFVAAIGRHSAAGAAESLSSSDASDSQRYNHGSNAGSGFDYTGGVWDSSRALSAGADASTLTSTVTENAISWVAVALKPAGATIDARVYQTYLTAPPAAAPLRARVYQAYAEVDEASTVLHARVYAVSLTAPAAAGSGGKTGWYAARGGNLGPALVYAARNGEIT